jgi:hypothetical protein
MSNGPRGRCQSFHERRGVGASVFMSNWRSHLRKSSGTTPPVNASFSREKRGEPF